MNSRLSSAGRRAVMLLAAALLAVLSAGCYVTTFTLGSPEEARVNREHIGDWRITWEQEDERQTVTLIIRNIDGRTYYIEQQEPGKDPIRMAGFTAEVAGATFAHVRELTDDGEVPDEHAILRVDLENGRLILRHLNPDFLEDVDSEDALRRRIAENIDIPQLYAVRGEGERISR